MYLLSRLARELGSEHVDHRLRQGDFRDGVPADGFPGLGLPVAELERLDAALLVGGYPRHEQPLLNHRLRKAARRGARIMAVNPRAFDWNIPLAAEQVAAPGQLPRELALIALALAAEQGVEAPEGLGAWAGRAKPKAEHKRIAEALAGGERAAVLLGGLAEAHPAGAELRALAGCIAGLAGAAAGRLTDGANSAGGWLAGAVPGRRPDGGAAAGLDARAMLEQPRRGYLLLGVEPEHDCWDGATALAALAGAQRVVALTAWDSPALREHADVLLPIGTLGETAGTFVNAEGRWQTFGGVARPAGEARPAWRVLRVLANVLELGGFEYNAPDEIHHEVRSRAADARPAALPDWAARPRPLQLSGTLRVGVPAMFNVDGLSRRAASLQRTVHAGEAVVHLPPADAGKLGVADGDAVILRQGGTERRLPARLDAAVPAGSCWLAAGLPGSEGLGPLIGEVGLQRA